MGGTKKIAEGVYLVGSDSLSGSGDCMVYAVAVGKNQICMIDAGTDNADQIIENINSTPLKGREITDLILTHCHYDHIGAAHRFVEHYPSLTVYAHDWDTAAIEGGKGSQKLTAANWYGATLKPVTVNVILKENRENINVKGNKFLCLHTPGHTPGSIAVLYETDGKKILFGQDIHGPFVVEFNSNIKDWARSMKELIALEADVLCEGHYGIYEGKDKVRKFIEGQLRTNGY